VYVYPFPISSGSSLSLSLSLYIYIYIYIYISNLSFYDKEELAGINTRKDKEKHNICITEDTIDASLLILEKL